MSTDNSIVEKIRKLLALADSNKNTHAHERDTAMQLAMELLAKHNLSITHVENATLAIKPEEVRGNFKLDPWVRRVLSAACRLYYTAYYMSGTRDWYGRIERAPVFVGTPENIAVTMDMAAWLINSIRLESNRADREAYERRSFRLGAADRIFERAVDIMEAEKQTAAVTTGTSLMVIRNQFERANQEHMGAKNLGQFRSRSVYLDDNAYADGEEYGNQVGLHRQVASNTKRLPAFNIK